MQLIDLKTFTDKRGNLTVIEKLPFPIRRVFYIYGVDDSVRGGHRHKKTIQAAVCIKGSCKVEVEGYRTKIDLDTPSKCLILQPGDFHEMFYFSKDCILMVLASEYYDENDYIYPPCENDKCICWREHFHRNNCSWFVVKADNSVMTLGSPKCGDYMPGKMKETTDFINQRGF